MAEYGLCTEGSDEVGHTPARPSSSSHCGHFAPFLPSTTLRCCAYKYSTSWIIHDQRVVYFRNFSLLLRTRGPRVSQVPQPTCSWNWVSQYYCILLYNVLYACIQCMQYLIYIAVCCSICISKYINPLFLSFR